MTEPPNRAQMTFALERAAARLDAESDALLAARDYSAEFPANDAEQIRSAIAYMRDMEEWKMRGEDIVMGTANLLWFRLGVWWADRPWRKRERVWPFKD